MHIALVRRASTITHNNTVITTFKINIVIIIKNYKNFISSKRKMIKRIDPIAACASPLLSF